MKEEVIYVVDSLGVSHPETIEKASVSLPHLFVEGGLGYMIVISLFLIALLIAAWKAPRWVKEIGIGRLYSLSLQLCGDSPRFSISSKPSAKSPSLFSPAV